MTAKADELHTDLDELFLESRDNFDSYVRCWAGFSDAFITKPSTRAPTTGV
jgi:hypothetical protein